MDWKDLQRMAVTAGVLALCLTAAAQQPAAGEAAEAAAHRARGLELGYNLDHEQALAAFQAAIAADPAHPAAYRLVAATMWINLLFRQGAVTADDFLGEAREKVVRTPPTPEMAAAFRAHIDRALVLGEQRLRDHPSDADAHFQVGAAYGFLTTYQATVRWLGGTIPIIFHCVSPPSSGRSVDIIWWQKEGFQLKPKTSKTYNSTDSTPRADPADPPAPALRSADAPA